MLIERVAQVEGRIIAIAEGTTFTYQKTEEIDSHVAVVNQNVLNKGSKIDILNENIRSIHNVTCFGSAIAQIREAINNGLSSHDFNEAASVMNHNINEIQEKISSLSRMLSNFRNGIEDPTRSINETFNLKISNISQIILNELKNDVEKIVNMLKLDPTEDNLRESQNLHNFIEHFCQSQTNTNIESIIQLKKFLKIRINEIPWNSKLEEGQRKKLILEAKGVQKQINIIIGNIKINALNRIEWGLASIEFNSLQQAQKCFDDFKRIMEENDETLKSTLINKISEESVEIRKILMIKHWTFKIELRN